MICHGDNDYETGDDADPNGEDVCDYDGPIDAYASHYPSIVCTQKSLSVQPSPENQRCNLFQTKAVVGPDLAQKLLLMEEVVGI